MPKDDAPGGKGSRLSTAERQKVLRSITHVPVIHLNSWESFMDPVFLLEALNPLGFHYGAVKLIPPAAWRPPFSLKLEHLKFRVVKQELHRLTSGDRFAHRVKKYSALEFQEFASEFKKAGSWRPQESPLFKKHCDDWSLEELEDRYWDIVENRNPRLTVRYGSDIQVHQVGSGFPSEKHPHAKFFTEAAPSGYIEHPWNLTKLPKSRGSLLQHFPGVIPGVTSPWLYIGMLFSSFCWHTEDDYYCAVNYQHCGDPKIWYVIPPDEADAMEAVMQSCARHKKARDAVHSMTLQVPPALLAAEKKVSVYKVIQRPHEFVLLWPRTFHGGFNTGFNCNEACNVAPPSWLPWGRLASIKYRHVRPPCLPYAQVVLLASLALINPVKAEGEEEKSVTHKSAFDKLMLTELSKALKQLLLTEHRARQKATPVQLVQWSFAKAVAALLPRLMHAKTLPRQRQEALRELTRDCNMSCEESKAGLQAKARLPCLDCSLCKAATFLGFAPRIVAGKGSKEAKRPQQICLDCLVQSKGDACASSYICRFTLENLKSILSELESLAESHGKGEGLNAMLDSASLSVEIFGSDEKTNAKRISLRDALAMCKGKCEGAISGEGIGLEPLPDIADESISKVVQDEQSEAPPEYKSFKSWLSRPKSTTMTDEAQLLHFGTKYLIHAIEKDLLSDEDSESESSDSSSDSDSTESTDSSSSSDNEQQSSRHYSQSPSSAKRQRRAAADP